MRVPRAREPAVCPPTWRRPHLQAYVSKLRCSKCFAAPAEKLKAGRPTAHGGRRWPHAAGSFCWHRARICKRQCRPCSTCSLLLLLYGYGYGYSYRLQATGYGLQYSYYYSYRYCYSYCYLSLRRSLPSPPSTPKKIPIHLPIPCRAARRSSTRYTRLVQGSNRRSRPFAEKRRATHCTSPSPCALIELLA